MVLVDIRETKSVKASDIFLQVRPGKDFELITILRAMIKDQPVSDAADRRNRLDAASNWTISSSRMKAAKFGVIFFGMGLSMTRGKHMNSAALLTLAAEMNAFTKFVAMPMRGHGNVTGADVIMRWQTGYPFGITFNRGYPRYNPGEFSTVDVLVRGDTDCAFIIGADPGATMPQPAIDHLARIPTIVLDPHVTHTSRLATRSHHDGTGGHQRTGDGLSHGRDSAAVASGPQVALSYRRRSRSPDQRSDRQRSPIGWAEQATDA